MNTLKVLQFTQKSGFTCPSTPVIMNIDSVSFLINMLASELVELAQTVTDNYSDAVAMVQKAAKCDLNVNYVKPTDTVQVIADQADALVDIQYYMYNAAVKHGINLDSVFHIVHEANMAKKFPDGSFHKRADGKILKPDNWLAPDVGAEIQKQMNEGNW